MQSLHATGARVPTRSWQATVCLLTLTLGYLAFGETAYAQGRGRGQTAAPPTAPAEPAKGPTERVRVPTSYANVHMGPGSGDQILVLVPKGTVLNVTGRDKEWVQVQLTPEMRKTGMVMRWYKNEDRGWMHDSTVELVKP